jgi:DNA-binding response OmpR family regulator
MSTVLVYSDNEQIRERVRLAIGHRPDPDLEPIEFLDAADGAAVTYTVGKGGVDLCILDGEAKPSGGFGLAREMRDEVDDMPATVILVARRDDAWLGRWSKADALASRRADPVELTEIVVRLLRERVSAAPVPVAGGLPDVHH